MTVIGANVLAVDNLGARYRVILRVEFPKYRGSFQTLKFAEKKPLVGSTDNGQLNLIYHEDSHLKAGRPFPLWTIQLARLKQTKNRYEPLL